MKIILENLLFILILITVSCIVIEINPTFYSDYKNKIKVCNGVIAKCKSDCDNVYEIEANQLKELSFEKDLVIILLDGNCPKVFNEVNMWNNFIGAKHDTSFKVVYLFSGFFIIKHLNNNCEMLNYYPFYFISHRYGNNSNKLLKNFLLDLDKKKGAKFYKKDITWLLLRKGEIVRYGKNAKEL